MAFRRNVKMILTIYELEEWGSGFRDNASEAFLAISPNALRARDRRRRTRPLGVEHHLLPGSEQIPAESAACNCGGACPGRAVVGWVSANIGAGVVHPVHATSMPTPRVEGVEAGQARDLQLGRVILPNGGNSR